MPCERRGANVVWGFEGWQQAKFGVWGGMATDLWGAGDEAEHGRPGLVVRFVEELPEPPNLGGVVVVLRAVVGVLPPVLQVDGWHAVQQQLQLARLQEKKRKGSGRSRNGSGRSRNGSERSRKGSERSR